MGEEFRQSVNCQHDYQQHHSYRECLVVVGSLHEQIQLDGQGSAGLQHLAEYISRQVVAAS